MSPEMEVPVGFFFSFGANNLCITVVTSSGFINKYVKNIVKIYAPIIFFFFFYH